MKVILETHIVDNVSGLLEFAFGAAQDYGIDFDDIPPLPENIAQPVSKQDGGRVVITLIGSPELAVWISELGLKIKAAAERGK